MSRARFVLDSDRPLRPSSPILTLLPVTAQTVRRPTNPGAHVFSIRAAFSYLPFATLFCLIAICLEHAQNTSSPYSAPSMTEAPPHSTHEIVREDVALATGDLHVYIPLLSLLGKGGQTFSLGWAADSHAVNFLELRQPSWPTDVLSGLWIRSWAVLDLATREDLRNAAIQQELDRQKGKDQPKQ